MDQLCDQQLQHAAMPGIPRIDKRRVSGGDNHEQALGDPTIKTYDDNGNFHPDERKDMGAWFDTGLHVATEATTASRRC